MYSKLCLDEGAGNIKSRSHSGSPQLTCPVCFVLMYSNGTTVLQRVRPADRRGTLNAISDVTMNAKNKKPKNPPKSPSSKRSKAIEKSRKAKADAEPETTEEAYHFIGYVPAYGKVWELDGLKSGPLEVGELPDPASTSINGWMDIARPALKMKMQKYGSDETGNIKFSLLALVADRYQAVSDDLEMLKRVKTSLERRMTEVFPEGWAQKVRCLPPPRYLYVVIDELPG